MLNQDQLHAAVTTLTLEIIRTIEIGDLVAEQVAGLAVDRARTALDTEDYGTVWLIARTVVAAYEACHLDCGSPELEIADQAYWME